MRRTRLIWVLPADRKVKVEEKHEEKNDKKIRHIPFLLAAQKPLQKKGKIFLHFLKHVQD